MSEIDASVIAPSDAAPAARRRLARAQAWTNANRVVSGGTLALAAGVGAYFLKSEGDGANLICTSAITLALYAGVLAMTRRVLFSAIAVSALIAFIVGVASVKRSLEKMVVHAYDLFFYFPNAALLKSLWTNHRAFLMALTAGAVCVFLAAVFAWRIERPHVARRKAALACLAFSLIAGLAAHEKIERRHMQFYWDDLFVSSFYNSVPETVQALWRGDLLEASAQSKGPAIVAGASCTPATKPPNIILIHEESVFPPSVFPTLAYDKRLDTFFRSADGRMHRMRVETYGGASWLTEFSVMTGLPTQAFGGLRQFLQTYMVNRLGDTLPQVLQRCGYRNVLFYPMLKSFISIAPFYNSIGIREIFDAKDQKAPTASERDRFYFANALDEMQRHFAKSKQPLFTFVETMATHWPYDVVAFPEEKVPGGGLGTDPEMSEFLRRLWLAKTDYEDLRRTLRERFPQEQFLIVHYGDHHPVATRSLLGFAPELEAEDIVLPPDSPGYITYFAVDAVNFRPADLPRIDPTDVAYLSSLIAYSARLPLPDSYEQRLRLMKECNGRYYDCPQRDDVLDFHRRLIDAGLLSPR